MSSDRVRPLRRVTQRRRMAWIIRGHRVLIERLECGHHVQRTNPPAVYRRCEWCGRP